MTDNNMVPFHTSKSMIPDRAVFRCFETPDGSGLSGKRLPQRACRALQRR